MYIYICIYICIQKNEILNLNRKIMGSTKCVKFIACMGFHRNADTR